MWQIGAEGGLSDRSVRVGRLVLAPAERADVLGRPQLPVRRDVVVSDHRPPPPVVTPAPPLAPVMQSGSPSWGSSSRHPRATRGRSRGTVTCAAPSSPPLHRAERGAGRHRRLGADAATGWRGRRAQPQSGRIVGTVRGASLLHRLSQRASRTPVHVHLFTRSRSSGGCRFQTLTAPTSRQRPPASRTALQVTQPLALRHRTSWHPPADAKTEHGCRKDTVKVEVRALSRGSSGARFDLPHSMSAEGTLRSTTATSSREHRGQRHDAGRDSRRCS